MKLSLIVTIIANFCAITHSGLAYFDSRTVTLHTNVDHRDDTSLIITIKITPGEWLKPFTASSLSVNEVEVKYAENNEWKSYDPPKKYQNETRYTLNQEYQLPAFENLKSDTLHLFTYKIEDYQTNNDYQVTTKPNVQQQQLTPTMNLVRKVTSDTSWSYIVFSVNAQPENVNLWYSVTQPGHGQNAIILTKSEAPKTSKPGQFKLDINNLSQQTRYKVEFEMKMMDERADQLVNYFCFEFETGKQSFSNPPHLVGGSYSNNVVKDKCQ